MTDADCPLFRPAHEWEGGVKFEYRTAGGVCQGTMWLDASSEPFPESFMFGALRLRRWPDGVYRDRRPPREKKDA
jgi:hypothetical protein